MPIIAVILLIALLYWLWPFILALAIAAVVYFIYKSERKRQIDDVARNCTEKNLAKVVENISELKSKYVGEFGTQHVDSFKIIRIKDIKIEDRLGKKCLSIVIDRGTRGTGSKGANYQLNSRFNLNIDQQILTVLEIDGDSTGGKYSLDWLLKEVSIYLRKTLSIELYVEVSVETRLAELVFLNHPELQWATVAINKIENALAPVSAAYNVSLTNELLQGNQKYLLRAMEVMEAELCELRYYAQETSDAIRKAYEFLSIPLALRNFENLDTKPLEIYARKREMREGFQSAIDVKREYDNLSSS